MPQHRAVAEDMADRSHIFLVAAILACFGVSWFSPHLNPYYLDVGVNVILAVSLNLINGYTGQFSLGHAGFMAVGAYTSAAVTMYLGPRLFGERTALLFFPALLTGGFVAALAGLAVGVPSLRLKGDYLAIVTLGFGEIIRVVFRNTEALGGALGLQGIPAYSNFFWTFGFAAVTIYVVTSLVNSTYGRSFIATHDDEVAASAMGVNTTKFKIIAFVVGAFFAGVAGGLYGHFKQSIDPRGFDFIKSIEIVVIVILGGMGKNVGVIVAAFLLTLLPEGLREISNWRFALPFIGREISLGWVKDTRMILYSFLIIVIMLARPQGLFAWPLRRKEPAPKP
jgi:branched-chain amino acid transport system permease protein